MTRLCPPDSRRKAVWGRTTPAGVFLLCFALSLGSGARAAASGAHSRVAPKANKNAPNAFVNRKARWRVDAPRCERIRRHDERDRHVQRRSAAAGIQAVRERWPQQARHHQRLRDRRAEPAAENARRQSERRPVPRRSAAVQTEPAHLCHDRFARASAGPRHHRRRRWRCGHRLRHRDVARRSHRSIRPAFIRTAISASRRSSIS